MWSSSSRRISVNTRYFGNPVDHNIALFSQREVYIRDLTQKWKSIIEIITGKSKTTVIKFVYLRY